MEPMVIQLLKDCLPGSIPFLVLAFFVGLTLLNSSRTDRWGRRWLWGLFLLYLGFSLPAVSRLLAAPLGWGLTSLQKVEDARGANTIVVLDASTDRYWNGRTLLLEMPSGASALRTLEAARVYRLLAGNPLVVVSGGDPAATPGQAAEGSALRDALVKLGVPYERILLDSDSQNTRAHAVNLVRLLRSRDISRFVLVTSPTHMRRALWAFRAEGADLIPSPSPSPVDDKYGWGAFWPSSKSLAYAHSAIYDYVGLLYYWSHRWL